MQHSRFFSRVPQCTWSSEKPFKKEARFTSSSSQWPPNSFDFRPHFSWIPISVLWNSVLKGSALRKQLLRGDMDWETQMDGTTPNKFCPPLSWEFFVCLRWPASFRSLPFRVTSEACVNNSALKRLYSLLSKSLD